MLKVEGESVKEVYSGKELDESYLGDESVATAISAEPTKAPSVASRGVDGKGLFEANCAICHQASGKGLDGVFPPLAKSDYLAKISGAGDRKRLVDIVLNGLTGKITVNGKEYNGVMTPVSGLSDENLAKLLTYVTNTWGNSAKAFSASEVRGYREKVKRK